MPKIRPYNSESCIPRLSHGAGLWGISKRDVQIPLFPSVVERGSQRPGAVQGAPQARAKRPLDGEDRCEIITGRMESAPFPILFTHYRALIPDFIEELQLVNVIDCLLTSHLYPAVTTSMG